MTKIKDNTEVYTANWFVLTIYQPVLPSKGHGVIQSVQDSCIPETIQ